MESRHYTLHTSGTAATARPCALTGGVVHIGYEGSLEGTLRIG